jgi:hypothetical protein
MTKKLSQRDIRTLKIGGICAAAIMVFWAGSEIHGRWKKARESTAMLKDKLELIDVNKAKQSGLMSIVPKFEMPIEEEEQKFLFVDKLTEQFKKAGIKNQPLEVASKSKTKQDGYQLLRLKCSASCRLTQVLDFLADLKDNPYLVGIEELRIRMDKKKPQQVDIDLTVSTFVK